MTTELAISSPIELAIIQGDLSKLTESERAGYYQQVCESVGLNPLTKPFQYLKLNGKLTLYATKDAAAQIRKNHGISCTIIEQHADRELGVFTCTVTGQDKHGRQDTEIGVVSIAGLKGEALCNAYMKAVTKAKRRLSLSLGGLGWLDETELETIPNAQPFTAELEPQTQIPAAPTYTDEELEAAREATQDFVDDDLLAASDVQLKRIGFGPKQGRQLLIQLFPGKTSRTQLTDDELRIFIAQLMDKPTAKQEMKDA